VTCVYVFFFLHAKKKIRGNQNVFFVVVKNCIMNFKSNKRGDFLVVAVALNAQTFD